MENLPSAPSQPCSIGSLNGPEEFDPVFKLGQKSSTAIACVRVLTVETGTTSKLGLIVPKKKAKLAVERNAFKRVARESFLALVRSLPEGLSIHAVCQLTGPLKSMSLDEIKTAARAQIDEAFLASLYKLNDPGKKLKMR